MTDHHEPIDPLDPRFVDAVLARARLRASAGPVSERTAPEHASAAPPVPPARPVAPATPGVAGPAPVPTVPTAASPGGPTDGGGNEDDPTSGDAEADDGEDESSSTRNIVEWVAVAVGAVVVAFLIRAFLLQAFYIPSESMEPTLRENDRILVNKLSYTFRDVSRGDLVVFEKPPNEPAGNINDLIKRVIALEGETIELHADGTITIDDRLLTEPYLADGQAPGTLTLAREAFGPGSCTNPISERSRCTLGEHHVWVMGDNRNHSHDSRAFGPVDEDLIVGRAFVKVWPLSGIGFL